MWIWGKVLCMNQTKMPHSFRTKFKTSGRSARPSWHSSKMTCMWSELAPPIRLSLEACLPIPFQLWEQGCFLVCCLWRQMPKVWVSQTLDCTVYRLDSKTLASIPSWLVWAELKCSALTSANQFRKLDNRR